MIEYGKYRAEGKLKKLRILWTTGKVELPEEARLDAYGRENIPQWERAALNGGRRAFSEYIEQICDQRSPVDLSGLDAELIGVLANARAPHDPVASHIEFRCKGVAPPLPKALTGLPPEAVDALADIFESGMLRGLTFTQDAGEIPTPEIMTRSAGPFPKSHLVGKTSALCVFTVRQLGRHDVIHVFNAGIENVTLVDLDASWMEKLKRIYSPRWSYVAPIDYRAFLEKALAEGRKFDVVITDPPLGLANEVVVENFGKFLSLCNHTLIMLFTGETAAELGFDGRGGLDIMSQRLSVRYATRLEVSEVMFRAQNVYWAVITRR